MRTLCLRLALAPVAAALALGGGAATASAAPVAAASSGGATAIGGVSCPNPEFAIGSTGPVQWGVTDWLNQQRPCGSKPAYGAAAATGGSTHTAEVRTWFTPGWNSLHLCTVDTYVPAAAGNNSTDPSVSWFIDSVDSGGVHHRVSSGTLDEADTNGWVFLKSGVPSLVGGRVEVGMDNTGKDRVAFSAMELTCAPAVPILPV